MSQSTPRLTPELQARIASFVRAGGYPHVAAEAAGVSFRTFRSWMQRGSQRRAKQPYRGFAEEVRQAAAQSRLRAEIAIIEKRPFDWLKCGPGKETSCRPGWSAAPKAHSAARSPDGIALSNPAFQRFCVQLLDALLPYPDVRALLAEKMPEFARNLTSRGIVS